MLISRLVKQSTLLISIAKLIRNWVNFWIITLKEKTWKSCSSEKVREFINLVKNASTWKLRRVTKSCAESEVVLCILMNSSNSILQVRLTKLIEEMFFQDSKTSQPFKTSLFINQTQWEKWVQSDLHKELKDKAHWVQEEEDQVQEERDHLQVQIEKALVISQTENQEILEVSATAKVKESKTTSLIEIKTFN